MTKFAFLIFPLMTLACGSESKSGDASNTSSSTGSPTGSSTGGGSSSTQASSTTSGIELEDFSFFVTSQAGLTRLSGSDQGFGGDLTFEGAAGIAGADKICETLAEESLEGAGGKGWRAFLSTSSEDAIDRIGMGPWYDRLGRLIAMDTAGLVASERPDGNSAAVADLPNENGIPNSSPEGEMLTNHDTMTGSGPDGRLLEGGSEEFTTCDDWTSAAPGMGPPSVGHSWPAESGRSWVSVGRHANGCEALIQIGPGGCDGTGVGCGGGYGGFYCFALEP